MKKLIAFVSQRKAFILFSLIRVVIMLLGLTTTILIVKKLSVTDYGIFSVALMLIGLVTTLGFSWSSSSILYYGSKERSKYGSLAKTFWARNIIMFISLIVTTLLFFLLQKQINNYVGLKVSLLILIWLYVSVIGDYITQYFLTVKKQIRSGMVTVTSKLIYLLLILVLSFDVKTLIILNIISNATVIFYLIGINKKEIGKFEFDRSWFFEVLSFSLWQLFGFSGLYLINFGDTAVIKHFMTAKDVGIYNAAYKLFSNIASFSYVISSFYASSVSSFFSENQRDKVKNFFYKERFYIFAISILLHLLVLLFSKPIIVSLYGERYKDAIGIFNVLLMGSLFSYLSVFYMLYYNSNKKYKFQQVINIMRAILNIGLDLIFIKFFGLKGPAIATTIAIVLSFIASFIYCERRIYRYSRNKEGEQRLMTSLKTSLKRNEKVIKIYDRSIEFFYKYLVTDHYVISRSYKKRLKRHVQLINPETFNDKIQWLKLNWYDPLAVKCADKFEVRNYIKEQIGESYLNELYGVYETAEEMDLDKLPHSFVLKGTHGSGYNIICKDKSQMNWENALKDIRRWLNTNYYWSKREWVYKDIQPRIVCEKYLEECEDGELIDYKIFCFNGDPKLIEVDFNRFSHHKRNIYDLNWNLLDIRLRYPSDPNRVMKKPKKLDEMLALSRVLSKPFPLVRIDFYNIEDRVVFGEMTFFHGSGTDTFSPPEFETEMGSWLDLPMGVHSIKKDKSRSLPV